jgi:hypothetical protein
VFVCGIAAVVALVCVPAFIATDNGRYAFAALCAFFGLLLVTTLLAWPLTLAEQKDRLRPEIVDESSREYERQKKPQGESDVPEVAGAWQACWEFEDPRTHERVPFVEDVQIDQDGRYITGRITDAHGQDCRFAGVVFNRMVTMYFVSAIPKRASCGSATLQLLPEGTVMRGLQVFFELDSGALMTSAYRLEARKG